MKNLSAKITLITSLLHDGLNFEKDPFQLSRYEISRLTDQAKFFNYKKPVNGYFSLGSSFFVHLQKIYNNVKKDSFLYRVENNGRYCSCWCKDEKEVRQKFFSYLKRKKIDHTNIYNCNFGYYVKDTNISFLLIKYTDIQEKTFIDKIEVTF